jgi:hypothetical protein
MQTDEILLALLIVCAIAFVVIIGLILLAKALSVNTQTITMGNCIFPLKLYNNMTAQQIENATLICYK